MSYGHTLTVLPSFLNNGKNSDLIRWSEDGKKFIVLDEDEFAKKLIPEMFKHNNYASFVRQLNMYGFHKVVGLADNSMRASEKKNKSPSMYEHPYFRRGYDVLQWLIQKPNKNGGKRNKIKKEAPEIIEPDSDDEFFEDGTGQAYAVSSAPGKAYTQSGPLAKTEVGRFREQLAEVQHQQQQVLAMIQGLRQNQQEIMQKAVKVEQMHQRHENSITAILNFLANVFRKSLEGKGGENLSEMLASILPMDGQAIPTGTVQDLGELFQQQNGARNSMSPIPQKRQHLLPGIPGQEAAAAPATGSSSGRIGSAPSSPGTYAAGTGRQGPPLSSRVEEVFDASPSDTTSPNYLRNELHSNPQETMMKIMGDTNARMTPSIDLPEVAAATSASMSNDQRQRMLHSMSRRTLSPANNVAQSAFQPPPPVPASIPPSAASPVQTSPSAPQNSTSLSPLPSIPRPPPLEEVHHQQEQIEEINRRLGQVGDNIDHLASMLAPLSPNGHIPGLDMANNPHADGYFSGADPNFDVNQWLEPGALDGNFNFNLDDIPNNPDGPSFGGIDGNDFDFSVPENPDFGGQDGTPTTLPDGLPVPTTTAGTRDTPSPAVTEEIQRPDLNESEPSAKRRRQQ